MANKCVTETQWSGTLFLWTRVKGHCCTPEKILFDFKSYERFLCDTITECWSMNYELDTIDPSRLLFLCIDGFIFSFDGDMKHI